jgi:hypothetical protein
MSGASYLAHIHIRIIDVKTFVVRGTTKMKAIDEQHVISVSFLNFVTIKSRRNFSRVLFIRFVIYSFYLQVSNDICYNTALLFVAMPYHFHRSLMK